MPAWLASITQVPVPVKLTLAPLIEQAPEVEEVSIENVTGLPEPPPVAVCVYVPPMVAEDGGLEVKVIVCERTHPNVVGRVYVVGQVNVKVAALALELAMPATLGS